MDIRTCIGKENVAAVVDAVVGRTVMTGRTVESLDYRDVMSPVVVTELIGSLSLDAGWLQVIKSGASRPIHGTADRSVDVTAVMRDYKDGCSLRLTTVHRRSAAIATMVTTLASALYERGCVLTRGVTANVYMTPPGSVGLGPHYDNHDVLVLQCQGHKHWTLFANRARLSTKAQGQKPDEPLIVDRELDIEAGQMLFLPRGVYHQARSTGSESLHITFGIYTATWLDLCLKLLAADGSMHEAIGAGLTEGEVRLSLEDRLRAVSNHEDLMSVLAV